MISLISLSAISIIISGCFTAVIILLIRQNQKLQDFLMVSEKPSAFREVIKTASEREVEKKEKQKEKEQGESHSDFMHITFSDGISDADAKRFGVEEEIE